MSEVRRKTYGGELSSRDVLDKLGDMVRALADEAGRDGFTVDWNTLECRSYTETLRTFGGDTPYEWQRLEIELQAIQIREDQ